MSKLIKELEEMLACQIELCQRLEAEKSKALIQAQCQIGCIRNALNLAKGGLK